MGSDMVVALGRATVDGHTLLGHNSDRPPPEREVLRRTPARVLVPGEVLHLAHAIVPQPPTTYAVLGSQPADTWGFSHGLNEHGVAAACTRLPTRLHSPLPGLAPTDLVRLALERCRTARAAVDLLADLLPRYGQCDVAEGSAGLLVADGTEAFAVETSGPHWVYQQVREVRAMTALCLVGQDWDRISEGLASQAIDRSWWPEDGSKLDFAAVLSDPVALRGGAARRWGRATLLLEQQSGHIDATFVRNLLGDHFENSPDEMDPWSASTGPLPFCRHPMRGAAEATAASLVAQIAPRGRALPIAWWTAGPPCGGVYFPLFVTGELPEALGPKGSVHRLRAQLDAQLGDDGEAWASARDAFGRLQATFDQEAEEFATEGAALWQQGAAADLSRQATCFMQHAVERFEEVVRAMTAATEVPVVAEEASYFEYMAG